MEQGGGSMIRRTEESHTRRGVLAGALAGLTAVVVSAIGRDKPASAATTDLKAIPVYVAGGALSTPGGIAGANLSISASAQIVAARSNRRAVAVFNNDAANTLFVGPSGVSDTNGFPVAPKTSIEIFTGASIHGVASSGTLDVRYLEEF
jgi:hypothetical protein